MDVELCLERRPQEGARRVALALHDEAVAAARRLGDPDDEEALHEFRVALRRLRSTLKAWRPWLEDTLRRRTLRRLNKVARATGAARDAEVQLLWLAERRARLAPGHGPALDWLVARLERRRAEGYREARAEASARFGELSRRLLRELSRYEVDLLREDGEGSFAAAAAGLVREQVGALREALGAIHRASQVEAAHAARIGAKRLRYLLEPFRGCAAADAERAVKALKELQDLLGELHDVHVLSGVLEEALLETAAEGAQRAHRAVYDGSGRARGGEAAEERRAGLVALDLLVRERRDELFAKLDAGWLGGRGERLWREAEGEVERLEARGA